MWVPGKYLPLLLTRRLTPKDAFLAISAEAIAQNKQVTLQPLIDWLRITITCSAADKVATSVVAHTLPPTLPIIEADFADQQRVMTEGDLPMWNRMNVAGGGPLGGIS
jgi:hypothetical protein